MTSEEQDVMMLMAVSLAKSNMFIMEEYAKKDQFLSEWQSEYGKMAEEFDSLMQDISQAPEEKDKVIAKLKGTIAYLEEEFMDGKKKPDIEDLDD